jgi:endonuclease/exonuclease/phosphatase family metal-dependent hydrolase
VNLNVLHGVLDEDPAAQPYDRFPERVRIIADAVAAAEPDVVFLQEVFRGSPDYPDVEAVMLSALGREYTAVFGDITGAPVGEGAIGQMTLTRLPVVSSENRHIGAPRAVHRVTVETGRGRLHLYNAHLNGTAFDPEGAVEEIETVLAFIDATAGDEPVVLAGDFNAEPDDPSIAALRDAGFVDAMAEAGDATCASAGDPGCTASTTPLGEEGNRADRRIDYVFVRPGAEGDARPAEATPFLNQPAPVEGGVLWASDHIGLRVRLALD